jgi:hypothetical protein
VADYSIWMLNASNITISGGESLSGFTQGDGSHLTGETIRLDSNNWFETFIRDDGQDTDFDDNDSGQRLDGAQTIGGVTYGDGTRVEAEYRLTLRNPATGETWDVIGYNVRNSSPSYGTIEGLAFVGPPGGFPPVGVDLVVDQAFEGPGSSGQPAIDAADTASPICFTHGTLIATSTGDRPIETLSPGDLVCTVDASEMAIRWIGYQSFDRAQLQCNPKLRPVRIRAGALGLGLPLQNLTVSRQHRILVRSRIAERMFGTSEVLVPAVQLTEMDGIDIVDPVKSIEYWHILFDDHQIVYANGAPSESLYTGKEALKAISPDGREEIRLLFPEICDPEFTPKTARPVPQKGKLAAQLVSRHQKNGKDLLAMV